MIRVLCLDDRWDEEGLDPLFTEGLHSLDISISFESESAAALAKVHNDLLIDLVLLDLKLPDDPAQGKTVLAQIRELRPKVPVIILTGVGDSATAEECCVRLGAAFYFVKGEFTTMQLGIAIRNTVGLARKEAEAVRLRELAIEHGHSGDIVGASDAAQELLSHIKDVCGSPTTTVLLTGERGVGKDLVADVIHNNTPAHREGPFVRVLCSAIPESIFEAELFGVIPDYPGFHSKVGLRGRFAEADGGTIFLNEIGDMPFAVQSKLLEVLESKTVRPVGGGTESRIAARIIAATNQDLRERARSGHFRPDLLDRISVYSIDTPSLRTRKVDIPALVQHFIERFNMEQARSVQQVDDEALHSLCVYHWPGNVRELRNVIERAFVVSARADARILTPEHFLAFSDPGQDQECASFPSGLSLADDIYSPDITLNDIPKKLQRGVVINVLTRENGLGSRAAKVLGLSPPAFRQRLSDWKISTLDFRNKAQSAV